MQKQQKIDELNKQLSVLKEQKDKLTQEAEALIKKRDKLHEQLKTLRLETSELKAKRDQTNEEVKRQKQKREEYREAIHVKIAELEKLKQEIEVLAKKKPSESRKSLQAEFDRFEWEIQTSSMSLQEEKDAVNKVKQIEVQLNVYKKLDALKEKAWKLRAEIKAFDAETKKCHEKILQLAQNSQEAHQKMLAKIEEAKKVKADADAAHKGFLEVMEKARAVKEEMNKVLGQIRQVRGEIREEEAEEKKQTETALRTRLEKQAKEKLERGEKLTWDEFQLLQQQQNAEEHENDEDNSETS